MLGLTSISGAPLSTSFFNPNVTVNVTANALTLAIGSSSALAGAFVQPTGSPLTLGFGSLTIAAAANVTPTPTPLTLGLGTITVSAAANTPIDHWHRKCYNNRSCECKSYRRAYDSYCQ
jgi:hypothetical protein